jgi:hypothetical protein
MLRRLAFTCAAALVVLAVGSIAAAAQDRYALVIANSKYRTVSPLDNPERDAQAVGALLKDAGFQVTSALDLDKASMSKVIRFFVTSIAEKPENSVALIYFAGHGMQVDGENFLVPVDAAVAREADVPLEAMRLGDLMSMLETIRAKTRIVILDACRDNPFVDIANTAPRGLALVNAPAGTLLAYSTSPGHTASDGSSTNSPFAQALLKSAREPGLPIESALKNVRLAVHGATGGRQTPWEVSALTEPFAFFPGSGPIKRDTSADKSAEEWRRDLKAMSPREAFAVAVREDIPVVYEEYLALYGSDPLAVNLRAILDRRLMMLAWQEAVALNTEAAFAAFLARYPNSDLSATARRLQQRAQNRLAMASALGAGANIIQAASTPGGTCPCTTPATPNNRPVTPGSPPPGTRASVPVSPVAPVAPVPPPGRPVVTPVAPVDPGPPVLVPGGPVIVPVVPIIPPRIRDPRPPHRDPHRDPYPPGDRGTGKHDDGKSGSKTDHRNPGKATTTSTPGGDNRGKRDGGKHDGRKPELSRTIDQRRGGRDINANRIPDARALRGARNVDRIRNIDRIQSRDLPRINAPRDMQRIHAPRGGGLRMGGGPQFRGGGFGGGGGGPRFRGGGFGGGGGGGGLRLR